MEKDDKLVYLHRRKDNGKVFHVGMGKSHGNISSVLIGSRKYAGKFNGEKLTHKYID